MKYVIHSLASVLLIVLGLAFLTSLNGIFTDTQQVVGAVFSFGGAILFSPFVAGFVMKNISNREDDGIVIGMTYFLAFILFLLEQFIIGTLILIGFPLLYILFGRKETQNNSENHWLIVAIPILMLLLVTISMLLVVYT